MTVYVDNMNAFGRIVRGSRTVSGEWSQLLADDPAELAAFALNLGLLPEWLRAPGTPGEYYDVGEVTRRRAVAAGAVPISYPRGTGNVIATKRLHAAALDAATRGWHLFPLRPGTKVPAVRHWEHEATTNTEKIKDLWTADLRRRDGWYVPEPPNVGIACGPSGLVVLDLDLAKPGQDRTRWEEHWRDYDVSSGRDVLHLLADQVGQSLPETYVVATPSGGRHLYFTAPQGVPVRNSTGHPGPMIDVRGQGGYVVAAGSRLHPRPDQDDAPAETGESAYRLVHDMPTAELPGWLTEVIGSDRQRDNRSATSSRQIGSAPGRASAGRSDGYGPAALRGEVDRVRSAPVGQRNHTLNAAAYSLGQLVAAGALARNRVVDALTYSATSAGLEPAEIAATIDSGLIAGARKPRTVQQARDLPTTADRPERSQRHPDARGPSTPAPAPPDPTRTTSDKPMFDQAAFDQAVALAVESAISLVVDAAADRRAAALREAAARVGRLMDVDRVDGQSALDALTGAAEQAGMPSAEIETTIAAGIAQRWPVPSDNRPPPVTTGSVVAEMAAQRMQAELDATTFHRDRDRGTSAEQQLGSETKDSPKVGTNQVSGADLTPREKASDPPYTIDEMDAAHAGWLFSEAWDSFRNDRRPCYPADTLRLACEHEGLPTLGKDDRRFGPRPRAVFHPAPGEELVDRDVWESWSQAQADEWHFTRHERARAADTDAPQPHRSYDPVPVQEPTLPDGAQAMGAGREGRPRSEPEPHPDQPADTDALVRALQAVLQTRGVIDRAAWDATVAAVAEHSTPAQPLGDAGPAAPHRLDARLSPTETSANERDDGEAHSPPHPDAREETANEPSRQESPPNEARQAESLKAAPVETPEHAADSRAAVDQAIDQARAAIAHLGATRAARRHQARDDGPATAVRKDRPSYWAEPEVQL